MNSKTIVFHQPQHTAISVVIQGTTYSLPAFFSMNDLETYLGCLDQSDDYRRALAVVISEKIANQESLAPTIETICDEEDSVFAEFVIAIVNSDAKLKRIFDDVDSN